MWLRVNVNRNTLWVFQSVLILLFAICFLGNGKTENPVGIKVAIYDMVQPTSLDYRFLDKDYNIWCGTMVKGYDGKYHLYYSRWPFTYGHYGWVTNSEVAYAVADRPAGPWQRFDQPVP